VITFLLFLAFIIGLGRAVLFLIDTDKDRENFTDWMPASFLFGGLACFSFHPRKVITTGEGGMVTTNSEALALKVSMLRNHGASAGSPGPHAAPTKPYAMDEFDGLGFNLRLSDIQAAIGVAQMAKLDALLAERQRLAARYDMLLTDFSEDLATPTVPPGCGHTYQSYVTRILVGGRLRRNQIMEHLALEGIQTRPGTHAVHRLGYYRQKYRLRTEDFPHAALAEDTTITLPMFPGMTDADQERVAASLCEALRVSVGR